MRNSDLRTSLAIVNFDSTSAGLTFELFNASGTRTQTVNRTLSPFAHLSLFVDELFSLTLPKTIDAETVRVTTSSKYMAAIALQFTGYAMTDIPSYRGQRSFGAKD
jgi:hypothetical protein